MKLTISDARVNVRAQFAAGGSVLAETVSSSSAFAIDLIIESDGQRDKLEHLVRVAHASCFAEATLTKAVPLTVTNTINGQSYVQRPAD